MQSFAAHQLLQVLVIITAGSPHLDPAWAAKRCGIHLFGIYSISGRICRHFTSKKNYTTSIFVIKPKRALADAFLGQNFRISGERQDLNGLYRHNQPHDHINPKARRAC
jgi:hypothetical protein